MASQTLPDGLSVEALRKELGSVGKAALSGKVPEGWKILGFSFQEDWDAPLAFDDEAEYNVEDGEIRPAGSRERPEMVRFKLESNGNYPGTNAPIIVIGERRQGKAVRITEMRVSRGDDEMNLYF